VKAIKKWVKMKRRRCINCGYVVLKSGLYDPYLCRDCERFLLDTSKNRYGYLDM
jgi:ribosomal protein S27AE